jgi:hypothetical protein
MQLPKARLEPLVKLMWCVACVLAEFVSNVLEVLGFSCILWQQFHTAEAIEKKKYL